MPKDILVLMTDQHRADWIGAYGADFVRTPTLDALASEGVRFDRCSTTCPLCMPARASFLTGMFPHNFGMWDNNGKVLDVKETYLHPLKEAGYRTCHVGKSHLHPHGKNRDIRDAEPYMNSLGWDDVLECTGPFSTVTTKSMLTDWMEENGIYKLFKDDYQKRRQAAPKQACWPSPLPDGKHMDDFMAATAIDYIKNSDKEQPSFVFVGIGGPHNPWDPPKSFDKYNPEDMPAPMPRDAAPEWLSGAAAEHHHGMMGHNFEVTPEEWARVRSLYSARVEHVDHLMGRILDAWYETRGRDTWVLFWSDHGEMLGDKSRICKSVFYRASERVPVILRPPNGCEKPVACDGLISTVDLTATLLDMAGVENISPNVFGNSLLPAIENPKSVGSDVVFSEISDRTMVYDGRWKAVVDRNNNLLKLFDTQEDPDETLNLAGKPGTEKAAERMRGELLSFLLRTADNQHRDRNG